MRNWLIIIGMAMVLCGCSSLQDIWGTRGSATDVVPDVNRPAHLENLSPDHMYQNENSPHQQHMHQTPQGQVYRPYGGNNQPSTQPNYNPNATYPTGQYKIKKAPPSSFGNYNQSSKQNKNATKPGHDVSSFEQGVLQRKDKAQMTLDSFRVYVSEKNNGLKHKYKFEHKSKAQHQTTISTTKEKTQVKNVQKLKSNQSKPGTTEI